MSTFCGSTGRDLSAIKNTKFKQNEIRNFFMYFKKFSINGETINLEQFKRSLGILGCNNKNFICDRLFDLIDRDNNKRVILNIIFFLRCFLIKFYFVKLKLYIVFDLKLFKDYVRKIFGVFEYG